MRKINLWMVATIILILVILGLLFGKQITGMFVILTPQDIAEKAVNYINENLVAPNTTAKLVSVSEFSNLYNVTISYEGNNLSIYVTKDGSYIFLSQPLSLKEKPPQPEIPKVTIGQFLIDEKSEVCKENNKAIVYFFGSEKCPSCTWEQNIIKNVTEKFKDQISFHENIDTEKDSNVLLRYSPRGYIPTIVIGCKYYRIGSGEEIGEKLEAEILTALICTLTNNKPLSVCAAVEDLINQVSY